ncbi:PGF-pre-PGF domain-containing protein, partial [Candidatus Woesearchaeota archaeon]|nr:PGF-pre-PGF domain-containing protein [Candidatus Woesearchaeota archaeon]
RAGTLTSAGSNYSLMLNESLYAKSPSSASYTVYLSLFGNDSVGQVQKATTSITVLDGSPTVSLDTQQGVWSNTGNMTLNCSATDPSNNLYNISLYTNQSGVAAINQTQNISGNASSVSFNLTNLGEGMYGWNCEAYDTESLDGDAANTDVGDTNKSFTVDMTSPGSITNLTNESTGLSWIQWNWSNPTNDDFNHTEVWLNNSWLANVSSPTNNYVATGLTNSTNYTVSMRTVDHAGNVNTTFVNNTASTNAVPDTTPPGTITNLTNVSVTDLSITWNWTNPNESDYNHVELYVNGSFVANVSYTMHNYTALGLQNNTNYTLSTRTVDHSGNINTSWVNQTTATAVDTTAPGTISNLLVINRDSSWLQWNWSNANGDYNHSLVYLNGSYLTAVYAPDHQYTASNLLANSVYMLSVLSVDHYGNVNTTWVNNSAQTNASYCGDTRCDTGESCSSCPVDCGECPVGEQGGGNAPIVTIVQTEPKVSRAWDKLDANAEITWRIYDNTIAIKELSFTTKKAMEHPEISITTYANRPVGLYGSVSGLLYYYLQVQTKNMDSSSFKDVTFHVAVEKAWLDANGLSAADVVVYRYTSDWVALPTRKIDETSLAVTYQAETPGFSYFAIAGKKPEPVVVETPPVEQEPEPVQEVVLLQEEGPKEPEIERPLVVPSNMTEPQPEPWTFIIPKGDLLMLFGFTALLIVFSGVKYLRQKKKKVLTNDPTL